MRKVSADELVRLFDEKGFSIIVDVRWDYGLTADGSLVFVPWSSRRPFMHCVLGGQRPQWLGGWCKVPAVLSDRQTLGLDSRDIITKKALKEASDVLKKRAPLPKIPEMKRLMKQVDRDPLAIMRALVADGHSPKVKTWR